MKNVEKGSLGRGGGGVDYDPHTQVRCLFKEWIFPTWEKNILIYSQMIFQLYQPHSLTTIGLKVARSL